MCEHRLLAQQTHPHVFVRFRQAEEEPAFAMCLKVMKVKAAKSA